MLGNKEPMERKGIVLKELKCGWPLLRHFKRSNVFAVIC